MTKTGQEWLTISLLRPGMRSEAGRIAKELLTETDAVSAAEVARRMFTNPEERKRELDVAREAARRALLAASEPDRHVITLVDAEYPRQLAQIIDPPPILWVWGRPAILSAPAIGIVGSRDATPVSLAVARKLGRELSEAGLSIVSGLARGVDAAGHVGALHGSGRTVAVLGSGLDSVYPRQHKPLAERVTERGAVVSELPPWFPPIGRHFPLRNRIISGLSKAVVIVEATDRSGSLITARMALEQGRDVLAVPGGILSGRHRGAHSLIKDGARLVETVEDVLEEIGWTQPGVHAVGNSSNSLPMNALEEAMAMGETYAVDDLAAVVGQSSIEILVDLGELELAGRVIRTGDGRFIRIDEAARRRNHEG